MLTPLYCSAFGVPTFILGALTQLWDHFGTWLSTITRLTFFVLCLDSHTRLPHTTPTHDSHTRPTRYTLSTVRVGAAKAEGMIFITELPDAIATLNQRLMAVIHACDTIMQCDALVIVLR